MASQKKNSKRIVIISAAVIAVIILIVVVLSRNKKANKEKMAVVSQVTTTVSVVTAPVVRETVNTEFTVNGNFVADKRVDFSSETVCAGELDHLRPKQIDHHFCWRRDTVHA